MLRKAFKETLKKINTACQEIYSDRLISLAVFGSVARDTPNPYSDIDLLIIIEPLPQGRLRRMEEFILVEKKLEPWLDFLQKEKQINTCLSPIIKTPGEVKLGSPLFLDMIDDAVILYDKGNFLKEYFFDLKKRLTEMKAERKYNGERWYWVIKPDIQEGETFEI